MATGDIKVSAISPTEVHNNNAVIFIGKPKYNNCKFDKNNLGDMYMMPYASSVATTNKNETETNTVVNSKDKKSRTTMKERATEFTTKRITGSEAYKNVISPIIDYGLIQPDDLVEIVIFTGYEYTCDSSEKHVRRATGKVYGQVYIGPLGYDNSWYSGATDKLVEQKFTIPTYTQMEYVEFDGMQKFAQAVLDNKYPYGDITVYNPTATGMAKFVGTK